jgi:hypothetical protein
MFYRECDNPREKREDAWQNSILCANRVGLFGGRLCGPAADDYVVIGPDLHWIPLVTRSRRAWRAHSVSFKSHVAIFSSVSLFTAEKAFTNTYIDVFRVCAARTGACPYQHGHLLPLV